MVPTNLAKFVASVKSVKSQSSSDLEIVPNAGLPNELRFVMSLQGQVMELFRLF